MCILWSVQFFVTFWDWTGSISWNLVKIKYHRLEVQSRIENINYKLPFLNNEIDFFCQTLDWLFPLSSNFRLIFRVQNHVLTKCTLFGPRPTNLLTTKAKTFECFKCGPAWSQYVQSLRSSPVCLDPPSSKVVLTLQCVPKPPSPSYPLYSRVPTIGAFASFSLRPACSFQTETVKKSCLHYHNHQVI